MQQHNFICADNVIINKFPCTWRNPAVGIYHCCHMTCFFLLIISDDQASKERPHQNTDSTPMQFCQTESVQGHLPTLDERSSFQPCTDLQHSNSVASDSFFSHSRLLFGEPSNAISNSDIVNEKHAASEVHFLSKSSLQKEQSLLTYNDGYCSVSSNMASSSNHGEAPTGPTFNFDLPLPPKALPKHQLVKLGSRRPQNYEFARVRSHHASLQSNQSNSESIHRFPAGSESKQNDSVEKSSSIYHHHHHKIPSSQEELPSSTSATLPSSTNEAQKRKQSSSIIVREYKVSKPTLKFIPRQTVKRKAEVVQKDENNFENTAIKKQAFVLGDIQGPKDLPGRKPDKPKLGPGVEDSYRHTISSIRSKISQVYELCAN